MSKKYNNSSISIYAVGNFTKKAVENFEEGIVHEHNYLEKVNTNLKGND